MNQQEWNASTDPRSMLLYLLGVGEVRIQDVEVFPDCRTSERKLRLFACECYHRVADLLPNPLARQAVAVAEDYADGKATLEELKLAKRLVWDPLDAMEERWRASHGEERIALLSTHHALALALQVVRPIAQQAAYYASSNAYLAYSEIANPTAPRHDDRRWQSEQQEKQIQADLLRCICGDPLVENVSCENAEVTRLAQKIYDERYFEKLPTLADAMEHIGCASEEALKHARSRQVHSRGCWVIDRVLGFE